MNTKIQFGNKHLGQTSDSISSHYWGEVAGPTIKHPCLIVGPTQFPWFWVLELRRICFCLTHWWCVFNNFFVPKAVASEGIWYSLFVRDLEGNRIANETTDSEDVFVVNNLFGNTEYTVEIITVNYRGSNAVDKIFTTIDIGICFWIFEYHQMHLNRNLICIVAIWDCIIRDFFTINQFQTPRTRNTEQTKMWVCSTNQKLKNLFSWAQHCIMEMLWVIILIHV